MAQLTDQQESMIERSERLYSRFGGALESEHRGEFIAISDDGQVVFDPDRFVVLQTATERFGRDGFVFRKIGSPTLGKWRRGVAR